MYLTTSWSEEKRCYIGVITDRYPYTADGLSVTVLDVNTASSVEELKAWFEKAKKEQPWIRRS